MDILAVLRHDLCLNFISHPSQKIISNPSEFEYGVIDVEKEF